MPYLHLAVRRPPSSLHRHSLPHMNTPNTRSTPCLKSIFPRCYHLFLQTGQTCAFLLAALAFSGFLTAPAHGQVSVYTQNYDTRRSGSNNQETVLTPALIQARPAVFGKLFTLSLDNNLPCMPLILGGLNIPGEPTNILLLKTGSEGGAAGASSLWAFNADTGTKLWQLSFGSSVGDGSAGTPVIDPTVGADGAIYLMTYVNHLNQLHAIDPIKGIELAGSPVTIAASASGVTFSNSAQQNTRPALLLFNGVIYLVSSHALDTGTYHGWVIGYKYTAGSGFTLSSAFCSTPSGNQGGLGKVGVIDGCFMRFQKILDGAHAGRAHGHAPAGLRRKERALGGGGEHVDFVVNGVGLDGVGGDGLKGAEADVQREVGGLHALCGERSEKFGGEMQPGGGRGHGDLPRAVGINGLVTLEVGCAFIGCAAALDVRRQGHVAKTVGDDGDGLAGARSEGDQRAAATLLFENFTLKIPTRMREGRAHR